MTEIRHLRCDRCGAEAVVDTYSRRGADKKWVACLAQLNRFDFCPSCWRLVLDFIHWPKSVKDGTAEPDESGYPRT